MSDIIKRRRGEKTTYEQFELYLQFMEGDPVFRSGILNPNVDRHHVEKKWILLKERLNCLGSGPVLSVQEWKKVSIILICDFTFLQTGFLHL